MKNYIVTGSLGHISRQIVEGLIKAGKEVKVITSDPAKAIEIEKLGAKPLVGSVQKREFIKEAFYKAEVVYTMIPPIWETNNWRSSQNEIARNYSESIRINGVKHVVNLSSIGAHLGNGAGPIDGLYDFEQMLNDTPNLNVKHLRPGFFFYNFLGQIGLIRQAGIMGANYGKDEQKFSLVHTSDIADVALEELINLNFSNNSVRYIVSDERTGKEVAEVLGRAIGKEIPWVEFTDEQQKQGLLEAGLSETHAKGYTDMGIAIRKGTIYEDLKKNKPELGKRKLENFTEEFKKAYNG